jgi:hypothetical protein
VLAEFPFLPAISNDVLHESNDVARHFDFPSLTMLPMVPTIAAGIRD